MKRMLFLQKLHKIYKKAKNEFNYLAYAKRNHNKIREGKQGRVGYLLEKDNLRIKVVLWNSIKEPHRQEMFD